VNEAEFQRTTSLAIEIMTAMFAESGSTDFAMERLQAMADEHGQQTYKDVCAGLINLASVILTDVRNNTGTPELDLLKRYALGIQPPEDLTGKTREL
jgi:hypothetical protein